MICIHCHWLQSLLEKALLELGAFKFYEGKAFSLQEKHLYNTELKLVL